MLDRWENASSENGLPDLLATRNRKGFVRKLLEEGLLTDVMSKRLTVPLNDAACRDFDSWDLFLAGGIPQGESTAVGLECLLSPRAEVELGAEDLLSDSERQAVESAAKEAAVLWQSGNVDMLRRCWHSRAPQQTLSKNSNEIRSRARFGEISTPGVRLFGTDHFAIALVEIRTHGRFDERPWFIASTQIVASPVLVALAPEAGAWKILAVGILDYDLNVDDSEQLLSFRYANTQLGTPLGPGRIEFPVDGAELDASAGQIEWNLPHSDEPRMTLLVRSWATEPGWPRVNIMPLPTGLEKGLAPRFIQSEVSAQLWTVANDGRIVFSPVSKWSIRPKERL